MNLPPSFSVQSADNAAALDWAVANVFGDYDGHFKQVVEFDDPWRHEIVLLRKKLEKSMFQKRFITAYIKYLKYLDGDEEEE